MKLLPLTASPSVGWVMVEPDEYADECPDCADGTTTEYRPTAREVESRTDRDTVCDCDGCDGKGWLSVADVFRTFIPSDFGLRKDQDNTYWRLTNA